MSKIEEKCKAKGVRLTDQRRVIAKVMSDSKEKYGSKDHPDVDELHKRVSLLDNKISIATVYRTVKLFEEAGIIERHDFKEGKSRYEPLTDEHHDHLIDINSGEIVEFVKRETGRDMGAHAKSIKPVAKKMAAELSRGKDRTVKQKWYPLYKAFYKNDSYKDMLENLKQKLSLDTDY